ncbi:amidohydrolase family protein [Arenibaculum pallidiluteum]|uniref:amidohydrolase family protein n=1 Tax=Arenibaculum pallidiluteum TaxID=2812559 RepID=UPI001A972E51|nr:amidohydrolase family protein [Arenibaculum pallidiluteum]
MAAGSQRTALVGVACAVPLDGGPAMRTDVDILVEGGCITGIGTGIAAGWHADIRIDGARRLAMPGLVNAHTHSPENLVRGIGDGLPLDRWLARVWRRLDALTPEQIRVAVLLGAAEMLRGGCTAVLDHFRQTPVRAEGVEAAVAAYEEIGLRAVVAVMVRDALDGDGRLVGAPWAAPVPAATILDLCAAAARNRASTGTLVRVGVAPSGPLRATDDLLAGAAALGRRLGVPLHIHVDETEAEAREARERSGRSAISRLHELGFLSPGTSLAHCVWVGPEDVACIAAAGSVVVHNPVSNLRLGAGVMPLTAMRKAGARVAVGTDGAASNDAQSVLEAAKLAAFLPRIDEPDAHAWPSCAEIAAMAIAGGAHAMGLEPGRLQPGARADVALFDLDDPVLAPLNRPLEQLVLGGASVRASTVLVDGRVVLRDGRLTRVDEGRLYAEARSLGMEDALAATGGAA